MGIVEMHVSIIVPDKNLERCILISQPHTTDAAVFSTISPSTFTEQLKGLCWLRTDTEGSFPSTCYM